MKRLAIAIAACLILLGAGMGTMYWLGSGSHTVEKPAGLSLRGSQEEFFYSQAAPEIPSDTGLHRTYAVRFKEYLKNLPPGAKVVELGCGNGAFLAEFRDRGWKLTGIDISTSGVRLAGSRFPEMDLHVADATEDLSFLGYGSFDAVIGSEVIEHVLLPRKYVANCFRLLKPGGIVVLSTPYHGYLKNLALAVLNRSYLGLRTPLWDYGHVKFWSAGTLSQALFEGGFEQVEWRGEGGLPYLWNGLIMKASVPR